MQPRNIDVFDGLRVTTDHIDHLQGSIHSAFEDFRGILGAGRVHRGFAVTRVDPHSVQVDPGLAFDTQRRRVISDDPVRIEVPAAIDASVHFVCLSYDQSADGEVEGRPTRIWDGARVDVRVARPPITDDAIVLAELHPAGGEEGFTVVHPGAPTETVAAEPVGKEPAAPPAPAPPAVWRLGSIELRGGAADATLVGRISGALRARAASEGEGPVVSERLGTGEVHTGFAFPMLATHASAELVVSINVAATEGSAAEKQLWRLSASASGHVVGGDAGAGAFQQLASGATIAVRPDGQCVAHPGVATDAVLRMSMPTAVATGDPLRDTWLAGLSLALRVVPRNGDGFGVDAVLEWNGASSPELADAVSALLDSLTWSALFGWSAPDSTPATPPDGSARTDGPGG